MLDAFLRLLRSVALICSGHHAGALENLALRQQLSVFKRTNPRPPLRRRDRLFWLLLSHAWEDRDRADRRTAGHGALASPMAPPPVDSALHAHSRRPSQHEC